MSKDVVFKVNEPLLSRGQTLSVGTAEATVPINDESKEYDIDLILSNDCTIEEANKISELLNEKVKSLTVFKRQRQ